MIVDNQSMIVRNKIICMAPSFIQSKFFFAYANQLISIELVLVLFVYHQLIGTVTKKRIFMIQNVMQLDLDSGTDDLTANLINILEQSKDEVLECLRKVTA